MYFFDSPFVPKNTFIFAQSIEAVVNIMPANLFLSDPPDTIDYVLISNILIAVGIRRRAYRLPKGRTNKISSL